MLLPAAVFFEGSVFPCTSLSTQGARIEPGQKIVLSNAMDIAVEL